MKMFVESAIVAIVVGKLADQTFHLLRRLSVLLIRFASRLLPPQSQARYRAEWLAELDAVPGPGIVQLRWAVGVSVGAGRMACHARAEDVRSRRKQRGTVFALDSEQLRMLGFLLLLFALYLVYRDRVRKEGGGPLFRGGSLMRLAAVDVETEATSDGAAIRSEDEWGRRQAESATQTFELQEKADQQAEHNPACSARGDLATGTDGRVGPRDSDEDSLRPR